MIRFALPLLIAACVAAGCSKSAVEPMPEETPQAEAPSAAAEPATPAAEPVASAEPEAEAAPDVAMPEGLPAIIHIYPELTVTEAAALDAEANQYEIKGETRSSVVQVMNYYIKYFRENGWEEDMIMEHPGNTVVSFKKDGVLQYVDATEGGPGSYVTITTGNV